jgi:hypothetical protein
MTSLAASQYPQVGDTWVKAGTNEYLLIDEIHSNGNTVDATDHNDLDMTWPIEELKQEYTRMKYTTGESIQKMDMIRVVDEFYTPDMIKRFDYANNKVYTANATVEINEKLVFVRRHEIKIGQVYERLGIRYIVTLYSNVISGVLWHIEDYDGGPGASVFFTDNSQVEYPHILIHLYTYIKRLRPNYSANRRALVEGDIWKQRNNENAKVQLREDWNSHNDENTSDEDKFVAVWRGEGRYALRIDFFLRAYRYAHVPRVNQIWLRSDGIHFRVHKDNGVNIEMVYIDKVYSLVTGYPPYTEEQLRGAFEYVRTVSMREYREEDSKFLRDREYIWVGDAWRRPSYETVICCYTLNGDSTGIPAMVGDIVRVASPGTEWQITSYGLPYFTLRALEDPTITTREVLDSLRFVDRNIPSYVQSNGTGNLAIVARPVVKLLDEVKVDNRPGTRQVTRILAGTEKVQLDWADNTTFAWYEADGLTLMSRQPTANFGDGEGDEAESSSEEESADEDGWEPSPYTNNGWRDEEHWNEEGYSWNENLEEWVPDEPDAPTYENSDREILQSDIVISNNPPHPAIGELWRRIEDELIVKMISPTEEDPDLWNWESIPIPSMSQITGTNEENEIMENFEVLDKPEYTVEVPFENASQTRLGSGDVTDTDQLRFIRRSYRNLDKIYGDGGIYHKGITDNARVAFGIFDMRRRNRVSQGTTFEPKGTSLGSKQNQMYWMLRGFGWSTQAGGFWDKFDHKITWSYNDRPGDENTRGTWQNMKWWLTHGKIFSIDTGGWIEDPTAPEETPGTKWYRGDLVTSSRRYGIWKITAMYFDDLVQITRNDQTHNASPEDLTLLHRPIRPELGVAYKTLDFRYNPMPTNENSLTMTIPEKEIDCGLGPLSVGSSKYRPVKIKTDGSWDQDGDGILTIFCASELKQWVNSYEGYGDVQVMGENAQRDAGFDAEHVTYRESNTQRDYNPFNKKKIEEIWYLTQDEIDEETKKYDSKKEPSEEERLRQTIKELEFKQTTLEEELKTLEDKEKRGKKGQEIMDGIIKISKEEPAQFKAYIDIRAGNGKKLDENGDEIPYTEEEYEAYQRIRKLFDEYVLFAASCPPEVGEIWENNLEEKKFEYYLILASSGCDIPGGSTVVFREEDNEKAPLITLPREEFEMQYKRTNTTNCERAKRIREIKVKLRIITSQLKNSNMNLRFASAAAEEKKLSKLKF